MYSEFMGDGYHDEVRRILGADEILCPNSIIDADLHIGAMRMLISGAFDLKPHMKYEEATENKVEVVAKAAKYYLAAVICIALKSRTKSEPFNIPKYRKDWDKKQFKYRDKANNLLLRLMLLEDGSKSRHGRPEIVH